MTEKDLNAVAEKRKRTIINIVYFGIFFALSVLLVRYALRPLLPFIIAYIVTVILNPLVKVIVKKLKTDRRIVSVILVVLFYATIGVAAVFLGIAIVEWIIDIVQELPSLYKDDIAPVLNTAIDKLNDLISRIDQDGSMNFDETLSSAVSSIASALTDLSTKFISKVPSLAISLSGGLVKGLITIISSAFLLMDYDMITAFIHRQLPDKASNMVKSGGHHLGQVLKKYVFSYALIMLITFGEIYIGLKIVGIKNALAVSALIAVFDILPIVGSGMVLFPWGVIELITGDIKTGIGILILWAVVILVRQIIEPKIVGSSVGMHPFLTLFAMLAGSFIYGGIGILLLPVSLAVCQSLNSAGLIHLYKPLRESDKPKSRRGRLTAWLQDGTDKMFASVGRWIAKVWRKIFPKRKKKGDTVQEETDNSAGADQGERVTVPEESGENAGAEQDAGPDGDSNGQNPEKEE